MDLELRSPPGSCIVIFEKKAINTTTWRNFMISETVENVKEKIRKVVNDLNEHISRPLQKYLLEMIPDCF